jgi:hypothetical protein
MVGKVSGQPFSCIHTYRADGAVLSMRGPPRHHGLEGGPSRGLRWDDGFGWLPPSINPPGRPPASPALHPDPASIQDGVFT